jgi:hypothetical protein
MHSFVRWAAVIVVATGVMLAGLPRELHALQLLVDVRVVAADTLRDVAVTVLERGRPAIYYNPALARHVGARLGAFFLAHEFGHVAGGHTGGALGSGHAAFSAARRQQELAADCYAAARLAAGPPGDVEAVTAFFTRLGAFRFDDLHPTGAERAAHVARCAGRADLVPPAVGRSAPATFTVRAPSAGLRAYGCEAQLWLDGVPVGAVSNTRLTEAALTVRGFAPGPHRYEITMRVYALDRSLQLNGMGSAAGEGTIDVARAATSSPSIGRSGSR